MSKKTLVGLLTVALLVTPTGAQESPEGESQEKRPPTTSWAETLARLNEEWNENCEMEGFEPEGPVTVQIGTVEVMAFEGEEFTLPVRVKGVCDLSAAKLGIQLDRYVAELVRVDPMPFLAGEPPQDLDFQGLRPGAGSNIVSIARRPGTGGVHGIGTLVRLVIRARRQGVTNIELVRPQLYDSAGELVEIRKVPIRLTVMEVAARGGRPYKRQPRQKPPSR